MFLMFCFSDQQFINVFSILQDYLDLPVIGGDSASENDSDEKSDIIEGDNL